MNKVSSHKQNLYYVMCAHCHGYRLEREIFIRHDDRFYWIILRAIGYDLEIKLCYA